jgi:hypothetical protein
MPARSKVLRNRPIRGEEALLMPGRLEPLHAPLPLPCRLMGVLRTVIEIPMLAMFHPRQDFLLRGAVALQFIRDDDPWHIRQTLEQLVEEPLRGFLVSEVAAKLTTVLSPGGGHYAPFSLRRS